MRTDGVPLFLLYIYIFAFARIYVYTIYANVRARAFKYTHIHPYTHISCIYIYIWTMGRRIGVNNTATGIRIIYGRSERGRIDVRSGSSSTLFSRTHTSPLYRRRYIIIYYSLQYIPRSVAWIWRVWEGFDRVRDGAVWRVSTPAAGAVPPPNGLQARAARRDI